MGQEPNVIMEWLNTHKQNLFSEDDFDFLTESEVSEVMCVVNSKMESMTDNHNPAKDFNMNDLLIQRPKRVVLEF